MLDPRTGRVKKSSFTVRDIIRDICGPDIEINYPPKYSKDSTDENLKRSKKEENENMDIRDIVNTNEQIYKENVKENTQEVSSHEEETDIDIHKKEVVHAKTHHNARKEQKKLTHALLKILASIDKLDDEAFVLFYVGLSREFERRFELDNYSQKIIALATNALKDEE